MQITTHLINAFSLNNSGGNPAGVVFDADNLSNAQKQQVAAKLGYPETAFVSKSNSADFKLDFFTPIKQIPHCGHATIATFSYLKQTGKIRNDHSSKETIDGNRSIVFKGNLAYMEQRAPTFNIPTAELPEILSSVGLTGDDLIPGLLPGIVNTGNSFLIIPVNSRDTLAAVQYDTDLVTTISEKFNLIGYYLYAYSSDGITDATTRMFAPFYGIPEEAGTGMAAGPLACYLYNYTANKKPGYVFEQGRYMKPPSASRIFVDLDLKNDSITRLFAGGEAYVSGSKTIEIL